MRNVWLVAGGRGVSGSAPQPDSKKAAVMAAKHVLGTVSLDIGVGECISLVLTEVGFAHLLALEQVLPRVFKHNLPCFDNISPVGDLEGQQRILFD